MSTPGSRAEYWTERLSRPWPGLAFFLLAGLLPCLGALNAPLLLAYDDNWATTHNPLITKGLGQFLDQLLRPWRHAEGARFETNHWSPLSFLAFALENLLCGGRHGPGVQGFELNAWGFRLASGFLHGACAWVLGGLTTRCCGIPGAGWVAALCFLLHPTVCESTCWVIEQNNILPVLFGLLALRVYTRPRDGPPSWRQTWAAAALLLASQMSKASGICWPFILVAWEALLAPGPGPGRAQRAARVALLLAPALLTLYVTRVSHAEVAMPPLGEPPWGPWLMCPYLLLRHLGLLLWPVQLSAFYHVSPAGPAWGAVAPVLAAVTALALLALRLGVPPRRLAFLGLWFALAVGPVVNPFLTTSFVLQDRYTYPALPALALLAGELAGRAAGRWGGRRIWPACGALALVLLGLALARSFTWRGEERLFADAASPGKQGQSAFGHAYLASFLFHSAADTADPARRREMLEQSLTHHRQALACDDFERLIFPYQYLIEHASLSLTLYPRETQAARGILRRVWEGREERPSEQGTKLAAIRNLAALSFQAKRLEEGLALTAAGLRRHPDDPLLLRNRLQALSQAGQRDAALREAQRLSRHPLLGDYALSILKGLSEKGVPASPPDLPSPVPSR